MKLKFKALLQQFVPLLIHYKVNGPNTAMGDTHNEPDIDLDSLHPDTITFVKRIVEGNVEHILCGHKQTVSPSNPLIYTPFDTDLLVSS